MVEVTKNRLKRGAVAIAIGLLTVLFIALFVDAVYDEPDYEDYCGKEYLDAPRAIRAPTEYGMANCTEPDEELVNKCYKSGGYPTWDYDENGCQIYKECNMCQKEMDDDRKYIHRNAFYLGAALSLVALIAGIFWPVEFIGMGFMLGGIVGLFYSTVRYFSDMDKWIRVVVIFAELCIVLVITYLKLVGKDGFKKSSYKPKKRTRFKVKKRR